MIQDFNQYDKTYSASIDLCAACIGHYRKFKKPLKAIFLHPKYYDQFLLDFERLFLNREIEPGELLQFDGVNINKGSDLQVQSLYVEFYQDDLVIQ